MRTLPPASVLPAHVQDLPSIIVCHILSFIPDEYLYNCRLVCKSWFAAFKDAIAQRKAQRFAKALRKKEVGWKQSEAVAEPVVKDRLMHAVCYYNNAVYMFGGLTPTYEKETDDHEAYYEPTLNGLWKYDIITKKWDQPRATGSLPPRRNFSTLMNYKDQLILVGGSIFCCDDLTREERYDSKDAVYFYKVSKKKWKRKEFDDTPFIKWFYDVTVVEDSLITFDADQSKSPISVLNLIEMDWWEPDFINLPKYKKYQTQVSVGKNKLLIFGGPLIVDLDKNEPSVKMLEAWLLTIDLDDHYEDWTWTEITVNNPPLIRENYIFTKCRVGQSVVFLGKHSKCLFEGAEDIITTKIQILDYSRILEEEMLTWETVEVAGCPKNLSFSKLAFTGEEIVVVGGTSKSKKVNVSIKSQFIRCNQVLWFLKEDDNAV